MLVVFFFYLYPWRLGFRCKCASYLFHGKAKWRVIVALLRGISTLPLLGNCSCVTLPPASMQSCSRPWPASLQATPPGNKEGVQLHLNLNRYGYIYANNLNPCFFLLSFHKYCVYADWRSTINHYALLEIR